MLSDVINSCSVCHNGSPRVLFQQCESKILTIVPYDFDAKDIPGLVFREKFCKDGKTEICSAFVNLMIISKRVEILVATKEYIEKNFGFKIESMEEKFGIRFFLLGTIDYEIYGE